MDLSHASAKTRETVKPPQARAAASAEREPPAKWLGPRKTEGPPRRRYPRETPREEYLGPRHVPPARSRWLSPSQEDGLVQAQAQADEA